MEDTTDTAPATADTAPVESQTIETTETAPVETVQKEYSLPDEYKDRGWANKIKSEEDLYKQVDNLTSLVGKKSIPKQPDWDNEESVNEFYGAMRPESADDYNLSDVFDDKEANVYKQLMYENGITSKQAESIFAKLGEAKAKSMDAEDMTTRLKEAWGSDVESNTKLVMTSLRESASEKLQGYVDKMPNDVVSELYQYINKELSKYGANETDKGADRNVSEPKPVDKGAERSRILKEIGVENAKGAPDYAKLNTLKNELSSLYQ